MNTPLPRIPGSVSAGAPNAEIRAIQEAVATASAWVVPLRQQFGRVIVGQQHLVDRLMIALLTNGHILLEGVPGLAKTLALKTLAPALSVSFQRIQFTPDMLPADVVGTMIYNPRDGSFQTKHGPVFANLILADEINRAPAKVQSALLEAMQERQVTLGDETLRVARTLPGHGHPEPGRTGRHVSAARGAGRPLHAQDRASAIPTRAEERAILDVMAYHGRRHGRATGSSAATQILAARHVVNHIYIDDKVSDYIVDLVLATRDPRPSSMELDRLHPVRRLPARDDLPGPGGARQGLPAGARLRHAAGREGRRAGRAASPRRRQLRGRGRGRDLGPDRRADPGAPAGAMNEPA